MNAVVHCTFHERVGLVLRRLGWDNAIILLILSFCDRNWFAGQGCFVDGEYAPPTSDPAAFALGHIGGPLPTHVLEEVITRTSESEASLLRDGADPSPLESCFRRTHEDLTRERVDDQVDLFRLAVSQSPPSVSVLSSGSTPHFENKSANNCAASEGGICPPLTTSLINAGWCLPVCRA